MRAVMDYCGPKALPRSTFLDWPELDQDWALAWQELQHDGCQGCGTKDEDWVDSKGRELEHPKYKVVVRRCFGCKAKADEQRAIEGESENMDWSGVQLGFEINDAQDEEDKD